MTGRIKSEKVKIFVLALLSLVTIQGCAPNWPKLFKKVRTKYASFAEKIQDMTIIEDMKMITSERELAYEAKLFKKGEKFRIETNMKMYLPGLPAEIRGIKMTIIYDGQDSWLIAPIVGRTKLSLEEERRYQFARDWWQFISEKGRIMGTEKVDGRDCYIVTFKEDPESFFTRIWVDKKRLLLIKAEYITPDGGVMLWVNSDFRNLKGYWDTPYKTEVFLNGELTMSTTVKSLEINKGLTDDFFDAGKVKTSEFSLSEILKTLIEKRR